MAENPNETGLWVQNAAGEWIQVGAVSKIEAPAWPLMKHCAACGFAHGSAYVCPPNGSKSTDPPLKVDFLFSLLPPFPPNHFNCKCTLPPIELPPPITWRELASAFEMASGRIPLEAPEPLELEALLTEHCGSTDPVLKVKE